MISSSDPVDLEEKLEEKDRTYSGGRLGGGGRRLSRAKTEASWTHGNALSKSGLAWRWKVEADPAARSRSS